MTANEDASRYHVLDAEELAGAVGAHMVTDELLVHALSSFQQLMALIRDVGFPSQQIPAAEATAQSLRY